MGTYAAISDVQARFQGFTFGATSKPTQTQAELWIAEAEAMLEGAMLARQLTVPCVDSRGIEILTSWTSDFAEGKTRNALGSSANDPSNEAGKAMLDAFEARVQWILDNGPLAGSMLQGGSAPSASVRVRGPSHLDSDGNLIEPIFTRDETTADLGSEW